MDEGDPEIGPSPSKGTSLSSRSWVPLAQQGWVTEPARQCLYGLKDLLEVLVHFRHKRREEKKKTLREMLNSKTLQRLILILVILDLVIVAVSVQFPAITVLALLNAVADRGLLVIFVLEALTLMYVLSPTEYIRNPWHVIDGIFICVSLILETHEIMVHEDDLHPASPFVGLSVRVWRILRIVHAFTIALELEYQEVRNSAKLESRLRQTLQRVSALESELYHEKHARAALERELARLNRVKRSYDALGVRVPL